MVTQLQAILTLVSMVVIIAFMAWFVLTNMKRNDTVLEISEHEDNVIMHKSIRGRFNKVTGKFYRLNDFFSKRPVDMIRYQDVKDDLIKLESMPIIGAKKCVKLKKTLYLDSKNELGYRYLSYIIYNDNLSVQVDEDMMAWVNESRRDLYKTTEVTLSQGEQIARVAIPVGIIILAVSCLIFFPKIYQSVMETGNAVVQNSINTFEETLRGFMPNG